MITSISGSNLGGRVARFAGNFLWQIRIEDKGQTQVCYKYVAKHRDPLMNGDQQSLLTAPWESREVGRPGAWTFGANACKGIYAGLGLCAGRGPGGYTIYRHDHWVFDQAQIGFGDVLGAESRIFGYEVDGLEYRIENDLPYPTTADGASEDIVILGLGLATQVEANHHLWGETPYIGDGDLPWIADALYGNTSSESLDKVSRGNGVMIYWSPR